MDRVMKKNSIVLKTSTGEDGTRKTIDCGVSEVDIGCLAKAEQDIV